MELTHIEDTYVDIGGQFLTSAFDMQSKLEGIQALIFDWDGVFNDGVKGSNHFSGFSEIDSMGINMLRFAFFNALKGRQLKAAVITGQTNPSAIHFAERESFTEVYLNCKDKSIALEHFCESHGLNPNKVIFFFDDILDLAVAEKAGIRMAVGRLCNPMLLHYIEKNKLADYISSCQGNEHAVREFTELLTCLLGQHFEVIEKRSYHTEEYERYLEGRNATDTNVYHCDNGSVQPYGK